MAFEPKLNYHLSLRKMSVVSKSAPNFFAFIRKLWKFLKYLRASNGNKLNKTYKSGTVLVKNE